MVLPVLKLWTGGDTPFRSQRSNVSQSVPIIVPFQRSGADVPGNEVVLLDIVSKKGLLQRRDRHHLMSDRNIYTPNIPDIGSCASCRLTYTIICRMLYFPGDNPGRGEDREMRKKSCCHRIATRDGKSLQIEASASAWRNQTVRKRCTEQRCRWKPALPVESAMRM